MYYNIYRRHKMENIVTGETAKNKPNGDEY